MIHAISSTPAWRVLISSALLLLCLAAVPASAQTGLTASAWPMFHHDAQHTGRSPYSGPAIPAQKWAFTCGEIISSPAIGTDDTVYVGSEDDNLYAINPDGTKKWAFTTGSGVDSSPALGADGTVYVGSNDDNLYAINPDGTKKWAFTTESGVDSSPALGADGTIYVGSYDNNEVIAESQNLSIEKRVPGTILRESSRNIRELHRFFLILQPGYAVDGTRHYR